MQWRNYRVDGVDKDVEALATVLHHLFTIHGILEQIMPVMGHSY